MRADSKIINRKIAIGKEGGGGLNKKSSKGELYE